MTNAARLSLLGVYLLALPAQAQTVYKWTDANGVTHYTAEAPRSGPTDKMEIDRQRNSIAPEPSINPELQQQINERAQRQRAAREKEEAARAEADKRAGMQQWQAQQDALLVEQCKRDGKSYCDDAARIRAAAARHERLKKKQREEQQRRY